MSMGSDCRTAIESSISSGEVASARVADLEEAIHLLWCLVDEVELKSFQTIDGQDRIDACGVYGGREFHLSIVW